VNCELLWNSQSERAAIWGLGSGRKRNGQREKSLKILGVTFTDKLSVSEHVDDVISSSALSMYAITVLRSHGMAELLALQQVFCAVVISRLTYAAPAWRGFTTSSDRQRIDSVLRRANKSGLWKSAAPSDFLTFDSLRQRTHSFQLPVHSTHLSDCNFYSASA